MKIIGKTIGTILFFGSSILLFIFWFQAMSHWMGFWGGILAIILCPGIVVFPIVFWIVEKVFPWFYFLLYGIGWIGILIRSKS